MKELVLLSWTVDWEGDRKELKSVTVQHNTKELHVARFARNGSSLFVSLRLEMETSSKKQKISTITPAVVLHVPFSLSELFVTSFNSLSLFCMSSQGRPPIFHDGKGKKKNKTPSIQDTACWCYTIKASSSSDIQHFFSPRSASQNWQVDNGVGSRMCFSPLKIVHASAVYNAEFNKK